MSAADALGDVPVAGVSGCTCEAASGMLCREEEKVCGRGDDCAVLGVLGEARISSEAGRVRLSGVGESVRGDAGGVLALLMCRRDVIFLRPLGLDACAGEMGGRVSDEGSRGRAAGFSSSSSSRVTTGSSVTVVMLVCLKLCGCACWITSASAPNFMGGSCGGSYVLDVRCVGVFLPPFSGVSEDLGLRRRDTFLTREFLIGIMVGGGGAGGEDSWFGRRLRGVSEAGYIEVGRQTGSRCWPCQGEEVESGDVLKASFVYINLRVG